PVLGEHAWIGRTDLEPVGAGVPDHVLDQGHRRARAAHGRWRFGVVGADQRWPADGEVESVLAVDAVDPAGIAAARPRDALFDSDGVVLAVVGRKVEKTAAPIGLAPLLLGGFDPVPARPNEVPPDVAGPSERRAAEDDEARAGRTGRDADPVSGTKHPTSGRTRTPGPRP